MTLQQKHKARKKRAEANHEASSRQSCTSETPPWTGDVNVDSELGLRTNVTPQTAIVAVVVGGVPVCKGRREATVSS